MTTQHELISIYKNGHTQNAHYPTLSRFIVHRLSRVHNCVIVGVDAKHRFVHTSAWTFVGRLRNSNPMIRDIQESNNVFIEMLACHGMMTPDDCVELMIQHCGNKKPPKPAADKEKKYAAEAPVISDTPTRTELISIYKNGASARGIIDDMVKFMIHDERRGNPAIGVTSDGAFIHESCTGEWAKRYINEAKEMGRKGCTWQALLDLLWDQEDLLTHERCLELALSLCEPADLECKNAKAVVPRPTSAELRTGGFECHGNLADWKYLYFTGRVSQDNVTVNGVLPDGTRVTRYHDGGYIHSIIGRHSQQHYLKLLCESGRVFNQKELHDFLFDNYKRYNGLAWKPFLTAAEYTRAQNAADLIRKEHKRAAKEKKKIARPTITEMESENTSFRHHPKLNQWAYLYFDNTTIRGCLPDGTRVFCRRDGGYIKSIAGGNSRHCRWLLCESKHVYNQKELREFLKCHTEKPQNAKEDSGAIMAAIALELADREQVPEALSEIVIDTIQVPDDLPDLIDDSPQLEGVIAFAKDLASVPDLDDPDMHDVPGLIDPVTNSPTLEATEALYKIAMVVQKVTGTDSRTLLSAFLGTTERDDEIIKVCFRLARAGVAIKEIAHIVRTIEA